MSSVISAIRFRAESRHCRRHDRRTHVDSQGQGQQHGQCGDELDVLDAAAAAAANVPDAEGPDAVLHEADAGMGFDSFFLSQCRRTIRNLFFFTQ